MMENITRRQALRLSGSLLGLTATGLSSYHAAPARTWLPPDKLKVLVAGGHPDDPESGCGGTIARYTEGGHEVVSLYLTTGEAGIPGKSHEEAARIRREEAKKACQILKARPVFVGQIDGSTEINTGWYRKVADILRTEKPDVIFTHWPIDTHPDHRAISLLVYDAWLRMEKKPPLYYFEVLSGEQTQVFHPTDYVNITATATRKREACFAHVSQKPEEWYAVHERMAQFRGMEHGCERAEAFVRHDQSPPFVLLD